MAGLLYKDFVASKGKIYVFGIFSGILLILILRLFVPAKMIDIPLFALCICLITILHTLIISTLEVSILSVDEGKKQKHYFLSLPILEKNYVASKYIYILLTFYVSLSVSMILCSICRINCQDKMIDQYINQIMALIPVFTCICLFIPTIEMPFFIGFGSQKGSQIKTGLLVFLFFFVVIYMMFGNLSIFEHIDLISMLNYLEKHEGVLLILQVLIPYCILGMYYLSYRISYVLFARKEWEND